jgi:hypothetical protein
VGSDDMVDRDGGGSGGKGCSLWLHVCFFAATGFDAAVTNA